MEMDPREYGRIAGPDGMAFDREGNLHVAVLVQGDITVLDPSGGVKDRVKLAGDMPTNIAFDAGGGMRALVTEASKNQLILMDTEQGGLPLY